MATLAQLDAGPSFPIGYAGRPHEPHCGVLATAIAANVSFETAWDIIKAHAGYGGNWKGRTYVSDWEHTLGHLGVRYRLTIHHAAATLRGYRDIPAGHARHCTLATFARRYAKPGALYIIHVRGHAMTLRNGIVVDQGGAVVAARHRKAACMVRHSLEIVA